MQTINSSRESILNAIRASIPEPRVEHPAIPSFAWTGGALKSAFEQRLRDAAGAAYDIASPAEASSLALSLHPHAKVICSAVPEIAGTRRIETVLDPHELADVDVGVVRAEFGVAENGAIWLTQDDLGVDALGFLSQHLIVLLDPKQIVPYMHEACTRLRLDQTAYGCFMMGPSATGDIEATLVRGAQGARSLNVFFLPRT